MLSCHVYCQLKKHNPDFLIRVNIVNSEGQVGTHKGGIMKSLIISNKNLFPMQRDKVFFFYLYCPK